ncbi:MAG: GFA family protein [Rhodocyclales bacterium]|nr:GFA family protein [Rhodocyclales bacterium]
MSGAPFRAIAPIPAKDFSLTGSPKVYIKTAQSGSKRAQAFCGECGTPLLPPPRQSSDVRRPAGCVEERAQLAPPSNSGLVHPCLWRRHDLAALPGVPEQ